jgi:hypothetical protein
MTEPFAVSVIVADFAIFGVVVVAVSCTVVAVVSVIMFLNPISGPVNSGNRSLARRIKSSKPHFPSRIAETSL